MVVPAVVVSTLLGSLNGYVLSKWKFRGSETLFAFMLFGVFMPMQVVLLPMSQVLGWLGIASSVWGLMLVHIVAGIPSTTLFFRNYCVGLPDELIKAAQLDGASFWQIFWRIILPLLKPAIIAMMILTAIGEWNNFLWPLIITESESMANLPVAIALLKNSGAGNIGSQGPLMAFALLISLPTILLYFVTQKHFVRGIALSGLK